MELSPGQQDARQLARDTDQGQRDFGKSGSERAAWARQREGVIGEVLESLNRAFGSLDILCSDLKKARTELNGEYVPLKDLRRIEADLSRLRKSIKQIKKRLGS